MWLFIYLHDLIQCNLCSRFGWCQRFEALRACLTFVHFEFEQVSFHLQKFQCLLRSGLLAGSEVLTGPRHFLIGDCAWSAIRKIAVLVLATAHVVAESLLGQSDVVLGHGLAVAVFHVNIILGLHR